MDQNFDQLKTSFDNILKELNDICKSIDDLNDFEQTVSTKKSQNFDKKYENYRKDYKYNYNNEYSKNEMQNEINEKKFINSTNKYRNLELKSNLFRKSRLPDDKKTTPLLSNIIGSAQECTSNLFMKEKKSSPLATKVKTIQNQVSFSETEVINEKEISHSSVVYEDFDYLSENERARIGSFYNSMGCFVYVSHCTAELYQLKREDEFDSLGSDPVKDYFLFLKNKQNGLNEEEDESKSIVNFMYINSGVPVIIFNSGLSFNKIRKKDLRIVLAERSTGFCMYEFKFDCLTEFENTDTKSVFRLSQTNSLHSKSSTNFNSNMNINYQNEFFEKFFNCKKRHAFKEHFLKFSIHEHFDDFYFNLKNIINDRKNASYFHSNLMPIKSTIDSSNQLNETFTDKYKQNYYKSNNSLNSVTSIIDTYQNLFAKTISSIQSPSLIICFFNIEAPIETKSNSGCLKKNLSFVSLDAEKIHTPKLVKQNSLSTVDIDPFNFDRKKYSLRRQNTASSILNETAKKTNLSKSVFNLEDFKMLDNGKNMFRNFLIKNKKLKKSDISDPVNFNHVSHLDKPVAIGKRYKLDY